MSNNRFIKPPAFAYTINQSQVTKGFGRQSDLSALSDSEEASVQDIINENLYFVVRVAKEYRGFGVDMEDLIQEGNVGLIEAARRYDPKRGAKLTTYAVYYIRGRIHRYLMQNLRSVSIPRGRHLSKLFFKYLTVRCRCRADGLFLSDDIRLEVSEILGVPIREVVHFERYYLKNSLSFKSATKYDDGVSSEGRFSVDRFPEAAIAAQQQNALQKERLRTAVAELTERERRVIEKRYFSDPPSKYKKIGREMGVSKQRAKQIEQESIAKLKKMLDSLPNPRQVSAPPGLLSSIKEGGYPFAMQGS